MQADPDLTRTVLVTTKLDTKLPQFSEGDDLEDFLRCVCGTDGVCVVRGGTEREYMWCGIEELCVCVCLCVWRILSPRCCVILHSAV